VETRGGAHQQPTATRATTSAATTAGTVAGTVAGEAAADTAPRRRMAATATSAPMTGVTQAFG
jgi:hypothetical protein